MIKKSTFVKFMISIILTLITLILLKNNNELNSIFYKKVYEDNISFASINEFYKSKFGYQLPFLEYFNKTSLVFNEKLTYKEDSIYKDGVNLTVDENYLVPSIDDGMVVFIGEKDGYGKTVIIEQKNGVTVWYSNLNEVNLKMYDYVLKGELVGNVSNNLYLVFTKDGEYVSYKEYI